jgi:hypothetical protein
MDEGYHREIAGEFVTLLTSTLKGKTLCAYNSHAYGIMQQEKELCRLRGEMFAVDERRRRQYGSHFSAGTVPVSAPKDSRPPIPRGD